MVDDCGWPQMKSAVKSAQQWKAVPQPYRGKPPPKTSLHIALRWSTIASDVEISIEGRKSAISALDSVQSRPHKQVFRPLVDSTDRVSHGSYLARFSYICGQRPWPRLQKQVQKVQCHTY